MSTALSVTQVDGADQHFVQFYEDEPFLCATVADFLEGGVRAGQPMVAIATASHRQLFARALEGRGHDVGSLTSSGQLNFLDARETLSIFMRGGMPDASLFLNGLDGLFARLSAVAPGGRVRAYGEMVDLLWQDGNGPAAIRLEELWNELGRRHTFTLLCAYGLRGFDNETDGVAFARICATHGRVAPAEGYGLAADADHRLRQVAILQQRAAVLGKEVERRKALERELRQKNEELERALHFSEMFVGILGHDLRNPLSGVTTAARLLVRRAESEKVAKPATRILSSAERMARMIDQLLDFTRIRLGQGLPLERTRVDLVEICRMAIDELETPASTIALQSAGDLVGQWDGDRLAQMISNLIGNALVHGASGGPVAVRLDGRGSEVVVEVSNAGVVAPDVLPMMFQPMRSGLESHRPARSSGLGLGLFISREIVVAHAGLIDVASSAADGTRITVRLPRHRVVEPAHSVRP
jgi:signal transduction histidine kinase